MVICQWERHFSQGRVVFYVEIFLLGQGEGHFWRRVIYFYFSPGWGGSPLFGENKAFMAEPSDQPAINDGTPKLKG